MLKINSKEGITLPQLSSLDGRYKLGVEYLAQQT